ncbi:DUF4145 domain-containing protein [Risungbinella massiliensis]|uniref:DUF4145 domain-containing protein n=1 Tax=Risungbinella massiliensis TaxID=1329796 RepID=UPI0005CC7D45|nr:DUF4145 domain-containing protein [Risungbinella massiliensis]
MDNLFSFLGTIQDEYSQAGSQIEKKLYTDPLSALVTARTLAEKLLLEVYHVENISIARNQTHFERLQFLGSSGYLPDEIYQQWETIRKSGNRAAHGLNQESIEKALETHRALYDISSWFYESYGSIEFEAPAYRIPTAPPSIEKEEIQQWVKDTIQQVLQAELAKATTSATIQLQSGDQKSINSDHQSLSDYLVAKGCQLIDKRVKGGNLWVLGGWELNEILFPLKAQKIYFKYMPKGGKATKNETAWYLMGKHSSDPMVTINPI